MGTVFLVNDMDGTLTPMCETPYEAEAVLQELLTKHPDLIPGDEMDADAPRRWLVVTDEMEVPDEDGGGRWSLDHLFLDQDGIPTFVECKRATDTRARREVVAQMLDYAANGTAYWDIQRIRERAAETAKARSTSLDESVGALLQDSSAEAVARFWKAVEENLRAGRVRLVFVADEIPKELRRLVEFLNEKMQDVTVVAVEVKQYTGPGGRAVIPRVLGLTEAARAAKSTAVVSQKKTTPDEFYATCSQAGVTVFRNVIRLAEEAGFEVAWYTKGPSIRAAIRGRRAETFFRAQPADWFCYQEYLPISDEENASLRKELLATGLFAEAGRKTLEGTVTADNGDAVVKVFRLLVRRVNELAPASQ